MFSPSRSLWQLEENAPQAGSIRTGQELHTGHVLQRLLLSVYLDFQRTEAVIRAVSGKGFNTDAKNIQNSKKRDNSTIQTRKYNTHIGLWSRDSY